jgi:hypothetical protein
LPKERSGETTQQASVKRENKRLMGRGRGRLEGIRIIIDSPLYMDDAIHCVKRFANEFVAKK